MNTQKSVRWEPFEALLRQHQDRLYAMAYRLSGNHDDAQDLLQQETEPDRERIREHLSGNYCRCTGYQAIIDAVETTARARMGRKP